MFKLNSMMRTAFVAAVVSIAVSMSMTTLARAAGKGGPVSLTPAVGQAVVTAPTVNAVPPNQFGAMTANSMQPVHVGTVQGAPQAGKTGGGVHHSSRDR